MKIRKATIKDFRELVKVELGSGYHKKKFDFEPLLKKCFDEEDFVFCAVDSGKIVGYITLSQKGEISYLSVLKKYQGRGIGEMLKRKVVSFARRKEIKKLFSDVRNDNIPMLKINLKLGFLVVGVNKKKIGSKNVVKLLMEKKI